MDWAFLVKPVAYELVWFLWLSNTAFWTSFRVCACSTHDFQTLCVNLIHAGGFLPNYY
jgi:hypothetical protein